MCRLTVAIWPFEPWPSPVISLGLVAPTAFLETHSYFCFGCRKCSLKQHFCSTDPSFSAAGCNSPHFFWGLNDRHAFHTLIFKQMSYSCCKHCRCDTWSFFEIFGMPLDRCYSMTVEGGWVGMVMDELPAFPGWRTTAMQEITSATSPGWLTVAPYGKNHKTLNPWPTQ